MGIPLMIQDTDKQRIQRWKRAAQLVAKNSQKINAEFQAHSRIKNQRNCKIQINTIPNTPSSPSF
jgi:hypothetical protein